MNRTRLLITAWHALFLQAAFNPERRQGLGMGSALAGWASLWSGPEARRACLTRHLESFNTNPAMAGPILGALGRLEADAAAGDATALERIPRLKRGLQGPFAASGDSLLWNGLRPAAGFAGIAATASGGAWGPILFLVAYNLLHLGLRVGGVFWGYTQGAEVHRLLRARWLRVLLALLPALVLGLGALAGALTWQPQWGLGPSLLASGVLGITLGLAGRRRAHGAMFPVGVILVGLIAAYLV